MMGVRFLEVDEFDGTDIAEKKRTDPYGKCQFVIGSADDFHCLDFAVCDADGDKGERFEIVLHSCLHYGTQTAIDDVECLTLPCNSEEEKLGAIAEAKRLCYDALEWCAQHNVRHSTSGRNQEPLYLYRSVVNELYALPFKVSDRMLRHGGGKIDSFIHDLEWEGDALRQRLSVKRWIAPMTKEEKIAVYGTEALTDGATSLLSLFGISGSGMALSDLETDGAIRRSLMILAHSDIVWAVPVSGCEVKVKMRNASIAAGAFLYWELSIPSLEISVVADTLGDAARSLVIACAIYRDKVHRQGLDIMNNM